MHLCILSLNPGYDRWALIEKPSALPRVVRAPRAFSVPGGKGINAARCLTHLGERDAACFAFLGGEMGGLIQRACEAERLPLIPLPIAGESRVNHTSVYLYEGTTFTVNEEGPRVMAAEVQTAKAAVLEHLAGKKEACLVICGTACPGFEPEDFVELADKAHAMGHKVAVDIGGRFLVPLSQSRPELIKINREEFSLAFGFDGWERSGELSSWLGETGIQTLILTDGAAGACAHTKEESLFALLPRGIGGPYTVGSGDSFFGGYLAAWSRGWPLWERLRLGNACGAANTREIRCGAVPDGEVRELMQVSIRG